MRHDDSAETFIAIFFAACVLLAVILLAGCSRAEEPAAAEAKARVEGNTITFPPKNAVAGRLATDKVRPPMERTLQMPGRLVWDEERTVRVFPPFAGRVTRLIARPGDAVVQGQPLAEMNSPDFQQAQADGRKARADLALASKTLERQRELHAHGVAALKDVQQAEADEARARAESERANARLVAYGHTTEGGVFLLRSPVAGTVVERNLNPGQEVRPDQPGAPLFVVTDPTRLWVQLDASEADVRGLRAGMPLVISSNQFPDDTYPGELRQLSEFVDPNARTVKLRGDVPNPKRALRAEMFVTARVKLPAGEQPSVDARAVYLAGTNRYAFVKEGAGRYTRRAVRVGPEVEGRMAVLSGLKEGEDVVVSGMLFLEQMVAHPS